MLIVCMDGLCQNHSLIMKLDLIKIVKLEEILDTPDDSDIGFFIEVDLKYPDNIERKTMIFPFASEN